MKLRIDEYGNLIDSRLVDLQSAMEEYENKCCLMTSSGQVQLVETIIKCAEALKEAHEELQEAEEEELAEEAEEEYQKVFGGEE